VESAEEAKIGEMGHHEAGEPGPSQLAAECADAT
jgi:hypothetical protein